MNQENKNLEKIKVAILTTTVREGRAGLDVAKWTKSNAENLYNAEASFEIVDIKDYPLIAFGTQPKNENEVNVINAWKNKINEFDAYIFITAEYNHSFTGVIKNAMDYIKPEVENKVSAFVGYGGLGGARAIEMLRLMLAELQVACVQRNVTFLLAHDFENYSVFKPLEHHKELLNGLLSQLTTWASALKTIR